MSTVRVNEAAIRGFFRNRTLGGGSFVGSERSARQLAFRMVVQAKKNASGDLLEKRSGQLADSVHPIIRVDPRGGIEVGVGSTAPYADYLESGTRAHEIPSKVINGKRRYLKSYPNHPPNRNPLRYPQVKVNHPGNTAKHWLRSAVNSVAARGF